MVQTQDAVKTIKQHGLTYFWDEYLAIMPQALQGKYLVGLLSLFWDDLPDEVVRGGSG